MDIVKIAAGAMSIPEKYLKNCINEYPDGYFIWEPVSGGKMAFVDKEGRTLATSNVSFKILYDSFRKGKRGFLKSEPIGIKEIKAEVNELFGV